MTAARLSVFFIIFFSALFLVRSAEAVAENREVRPPTGTSPLATAVETFAERPSPQTKPPLLRSGEALTSALAKYLTVPFRNDGALNLNGQWVTFNHPDKELKSPGFNCSGFAVAAARELLYEDFPLSEVTFDRLGDSGQGSPLGQDWDFGLDLALNLTENHPRRFLPPPPAEAEPGQPPLVPLRPGRALGWGIDIQSPELDTLLRQINPGHFAFFLFSKPDRRFPGGVSYYHVGLIVPEPPAIWLYHSTKGARTYRLNLADPKGISRLRREFPAIPGGERRILMVEVIPPGAICPPKDDFS